MGEAALSFQLDPDRARALAARSEKSARRVRAFAVFALVAAVHFTGWVLIDALSPRVGPFDPFVVFGRIVLLVLLPLALGYTALRAARAREAFASRLRLFAQLLGRRATTSVEALATATPWAIEECRAVLDTAVAAGAGSLVRSDALPIVPATGFDRARFVERHRAELRRAWWCSVAALLAFGFASWWLLVVVIGIVKGDVLIALVMGLFSVGLPSGLGVLAVRARRRADARALQLLRLSAVVSIHDVRGFDELAEWLGWTVDEAREGALSARTLGVLSEEGLSVLGGDTIVAASGARSLRPRRRAAAVAVDSLIGQTIDARWHVEALLGHGGMGAVFRVRDLERGPPRALKVILPEVADDPGFRARFAREIEAAGRLVHPNVAQVHAVGEHEGAPWLVMDLLEGETLERRLERRGALPFTEALRIVVDVGEALAAAHDAGLLHRDVKPANVFLARSVRGERAVLLDFGLAAPLALDATRITASATAVGTPLYMSPEQARGEPLDARSDLHTLAAVLHEMLTGVPPFFDRNAATIYARLLGSAAPRLTDVAPDVAPATVDAELSRALATDRAARHPDVRAFLAALTAAAAARAA